MHFVCGSVMTLWFANSVCVALPHHNAYPIQPFLLNKKQIEWKVPVVLHFSFIFSTSSHVQRDTTSSLASHAHGEARSADNDELNRTWCCLLGGRVAQLIEESTIFAKNCGGAIEAASWLPDFAGHERVRGAAAVDGGRRHPVGAGGRRRRRRLLHEGPRPLHERQRHLLRLRRHRHPHRHVPPHGHLRAPHQARLGGQPGLPRRRRRPRAAAVPLGPAPAARPRLAGEARASAQDRGRGGRGGPDGGDAGAAVPDVPGAAGAAPVPLPERSRALASAP